MLHVLAEPGVLRDNGSSLLTVAAGEFAPAIARAWPAPHVGFLTASAARRHLALLALATGRPLTGDLIRGIEAGRLRRVIGQAVPGAPPGLERALGRLGELAWTGDDYRRLLDLLGQPKLAKVLRHAELITCDMVRKLWPLPPPLHAAARLVLQLDEVGLEVLREVFGVIGVRDGAAAADAAARRWARKATPAALFEAVKDDLYPEPATPPHPGTERLRPLASKAAIVGAARRFRNCLRTQTPYAASGWSAFYEWAGPPAAIVEIQRDGVFGWRLEEARLADNAPVPASERDEIISELVLIGVHVGRSGWALDRAVSTAGLAPEQRRGFVLAPLDEARAEAFDTG